MVVAALGCQPPGDGSAIPPPSPPVGEPARPILAMRVVGDDFQWHLRYPGPDGRLDTPDDVLTLRHLHLPADTEISIDLQSKDYVYSFYLPHITLIEVAVPGRPFKVELATGSPGTYKLLGSQMCGYAHPNLLADVVVHPRTDFETWLAQAGS